MNQAAFTQHRCRCPDPQGSHEIAYIQWGDTRNPRILLCLHGLTRNGRDFDYLAAVLAQEYRVICPDIVGRGQSDWLKRSEDYSLTVYINDILTLLTELQISTVDWLGNSLGGLIGMSLAAQHPQRIRRLILNDIGAFIPQTALAQIEQYFIHKPDYFQSLEAVDIFFRATHQALGALTDEQWQHLAYHCVHLLPNGGYCLAYDPKLAQVFQNFAQQDVVLWATWREVHCPVLILHGLESVLLSTETIAAMQAIHPQTEIVTFPGIGHTPALMSAEQIEVVRQWLLKSR